MKNKLTKLSQIVIVFLLLLFIGQLNSFANSTDKSESDSIKKHLPITAFWWNGGWDHYDSNTLKYLDEIIIFAVAPNPETGELLKFESNKDTGEITYKRSSGAGLTTSMVKTIVKDAKEHNVKVTLGINGMGKRDAIFNELVRNNKQELFAKNILDFCLKYEVDCVDVDYEHPKSDEDVEFLGKIYMALSEKLKPHGIQISGAFGSRREHTRKFLKQYHHLLDQVNVMCYLSTAFSFEKTLNSLHTELGIPKHKIFGGIGFYAKDKKNKVSISYRKLVKLTTVTNKEESFTLTNPDKPNQDLNLLFNNSEQSLIKKVDFLRNNGFGGIMIWALNHDVSTSDPNSRIKFLHSITN